MEIISIAAIAKNRAIGKDNRLLWRLPEDMKFFREQTMGHPIVTGRKNYESIPEKFRPLPGRENWVVTRQKNYHAPEAKVFTTIEDVLKYAQEHTFKKIFIIGGGEIYKAFHEQDLIDEMLITHVDVSLEADTFYPEIDESAWNTKKLIEKEQDDKHIYSFKIIKYTKKTFESCIVTD